MISRTSLLGFLAAGAIACGSSQQQQQASSPTYGTMNAQGPQANEATMSSNSSETPISTGNSATTPPSAVDRPGAIGVSGPPGPPVSTPGASATSVPNREYRAPATTGVTNEQPAANPEDLSGLSDAQLSALVIGIHESEIKAGELAESNAASPAVKKLAEHMVGSHRTLLANDRTVLARNRISPTPSALSEQMKGDADGQFTTLSSMHGKDFDTAYVDDMVRGHKQALRLLDRIIGEVKSADLKSDLQAARTHIEEHLREAQRTRDMMATQVTTANPAGTGNTEMPRTRSQGVSGGGSK
jgi:predicted outer membrane protein